MAKYKLPHKVFSPFSIEGKDGDVYLRPGSTIELTDEQFEKVRKLEPMCARLTQKLPEVVKVSPVPEPVPVEEPDEELFYSELEAEESGF